MFFLKKKNPDLDLDFIKHPLLCSDLDKKSHPTDTLITLSIKAVQKARALNLEDLRRRIMTPPYFAEIWPGEHYKLLAGLVMTINPKIVIEIGTKEGLATLSLRKYLHDNSRLYTFDIIKWHEKPQTHLTNEDFQEGKITQYTDDISLKENFEIHSDLISKSEFLVLNIIKGSCENKILEMLKTINFRKKPYLIIDGIRTFHLMKIWRNLKMPKLDLTSFGHWAGTGLVEWEP